MPLSKLLSLPFAAITLIFLYLAWQTDGEWAPYILIGFLPLALMYIMGSEIDWWWYERNPPKLEEPMVTMLETGLPFYQRLTEADKLRFRQKVAMFIIGNEWVPQLWEEIPRDVKVAIAAQAVIPIFDRPEWIYPEYETIVVHPKGFMSPEHPFTHFAEVFGEDKCVLFSAEHVLAPLMLRNGAPLIGVYEYARVARLTGLLAGMSESATAADLAAMQQATGLPTEMDAVAVAYEKAWRV